MGALDINKLFLYMFVNGVYNWWSGCGTPDGALSDSAVDAIVAIVLLMYCLPRCL